ncbi:MAG: NAD(P)-dependent oxidoreductase [Nitrosopumilaceae archaeon]|nr:NAD(P)-dependent oxidoreductase [Nitrosopumilaceae archaeon]
MGDVLVVGSAGFIGSVLVRTLESRGHRVHGLQRGGADGPGVILGDITKPPVPVGDVSYDCVFHLASLTPMVRDAGVLRSVNVEGARNLFEAVRDRTDAFVYASGLGAYGSVDGVISESTPYRPDTEFAQIRQEAHQYLEDGCRGAGIRFSAVMFGDVYGPGGWFRDMLVKRIRAGTMMLPAGGRYRKAFLHVEDAAGIMSAVLNAGLERPAYVAASPQSVTFREFVWHTADALGVRRPRGVPAFAARLVLGKDLTKLLCTPTAVSGEAVSEIYQLKHADYGSGLDSSISALEGS